MRTITSDMMSKFKSYLADGEKSDATIEKYLRDVTKFMDWSEHRPIDQALVLEYKQHLVNQYAPKSVNSMLSSLNTFFDRNNWCDVKVKMLKIQHSAYLNKEQELTKEEYEKLLHTAKVNGNIRLFCLMQTLCGTGIRISELEFITYEAIYSEKTVINCKGKFRTVFLPTKLCELLKNYAESHRITTGPIFISKNGRPLDRSNIWSDLKKLSASAGVSKEKVFPHNFRHLFAKTYYSSEKDIVRLADILGHSSIDTTRIYTMENGDTHIRQINRLGLVVY